MNNEIVLKQIDVGVSYKQVQNLLIQLFNNQILQQNTQLIQSKVITHRFLLENVIFFNQHADDAYNSECYKPISYLDESRITNEYILIDIQNGSQMKPLGRSSSFTPFEKSLNNISIYQKHKFYRKNKNIVESKEPKDPRDQSCNYKFVHPVRTRLIDHDCVLNRNYYAAFANGHENTQALGLNPYNFVFTDTDVEKQFGEIDDCNILEEQLMRYDVFISNLKMTQLLLSQYTKDLSAHTEGSARPQLQLPSNCQLLLRSVLGDEYFQQLQVYTDIAAPFVLKRVTESLNELMRWRDLVVAPMFSKRVNQIYFHTLDFQSRNLVEQDKKQL